MIEIDLKTTPIYLFDNRENKPRFFQDYPGLCEWIKTEKIEDKKPAAATKKFLDGAKIAARALYWQGRDFLPGQTEQCCNFVRYVLKECGYTIGVTVKPSDGIETSSGYASSLAGDDIGLLVSKKDLQPGDIVLFKNTYGNWPEGTITHVGIYTGDGYFIHRPTASKPVLKQDLEAYGCFREGRRLYL